MAITPTYNEDFPFLYECGKDNCFYRVVTQTYKEAQEQHKHPCPYGATINFGAGMTQSILEKAWASLDEVVADLKSKREDIDRDFLRGKARGIAEVLALFMPPHFRTPEDIAREALVRYKAATADPPEEHETPGLGSLRYTFPDDPKYKTALAQTAETKRRAEKGRERVDEKTRGNILAVKGMFTLTQTAELYSLSEATIQRIWDEG